MKRKKRLVIVLSGPQLAGKGMLIKTILSWCDKRNVTYISTGAIMRQCLKGMKIPMLREHCSAMVMALSHRNALGDDFLARRVENLILKSSRKVILFDSMRMLQDKEMIDGLDREVFEVLKVHVTASKRIRHKRLRERKRNGEHKLSYRQFCRDEQLATERYIASLGKEAHVRLSFGNDYPKNDTKRLAFCADFLHTH